MATLVTRRGAQGEGNHIMPRDAGSVNGGKGVYIYHEYDTDSFTATTLDSSTFDVPSICEGTTNVCSFP